LAGLSNRFWFESIFSSVAGILAIITSFWHDWIEIVFGTDPDSGNGSAEWLVVSILLLVAVILAVGARYEWKRAQIVARS
jgi:hypothetical protein